MPFVAAPRSPATASRLAAEAAVSVVELATARGAGALLSASGPPEAEPLAAGSVVGAEAVGADETEPVIVVCAERERWGRDYGSGSPE